MSNGVKIEGLISHVVLGDLRDLQDNAIDGFVSKLLGVVTTTAFKNLD
jgi:hypothetical protein